MDYAQNVGELCRLCGSDEGIKVDIFQPEQNYVDMIIRFIQIDIKDSDVLPTRMCHRCAILLSEFYEFSLKCVRVQDVLENMLSNDSKAFKAVSKGKLPSAESQKVKDVYPKKPSSVYSYDDEMDGSVRASDDCADDDNDVSDSEDYDCGESVSGDSYRSFQTEEEEPLKVKSPLKRSNESSVFQMARNSVRKKKGSIEHDMHKRVRDMASSSQPPHSESTPKLASGSGGGDGIPSHIIETKIPMAGTIYTCEYCEQTFVNKAPASSHVCSNLLSNTKREEIMTCSSNTYTCELCYQVFSRQAVLAAHKAVHLNNSSGEASDDEIYDENVCFFGQKKKKKRRCNRINREGGVNYKLFFDNDEQDIEMKK